MAIPVRKGGRETKREQVPAGSGDPSGRARQVLVNGHSRARPE